MNRLLTVADLGKRGWTPFLVRQFALQLDAAAVHRFGPLRPRYDPARVAQIEASPEFRTAVAEAQQRNGTAKAAAAASRRKLLDWVKSLDIQVPVMAWEVLVERACARYNARKGRRRRAAAAGADASFLHRICVNYLRHELTCYQEALTAIRDRFGGDEARSMLRTRILSSIARAYPRLGSACEARQQRYDDGEPVFYPGRARQRKGQSREKTPCQADGHTVCDNVPIGQQLRPMLAEH